MKEVVINKSPLTGHFEMVVLNEGPVSKSRRSYVVDAKTFHSNIRMLTEYMVENEDIFN